MATGTVKRGRGWQNVDITVKLMTGKTMSFNQISLNTTIRELKLKVEDACGIPSQCQRLTYLDMCDMFDHKTLAQSDVVDKGRFNMQVWAPFGPLVKAASGGHLTQVFQAGLINNRGYINKDEAFLALYIASHCGHIRLVLMLLSYGVNINASTKLGRTALHAAGIKGQWSVLCLLINWGANIYTKDDAGLTAMDYARIFGHRECARGLALYQWHLNKEQSTVRSGCTEEKGIDIMSQFPPHWITEMPGCNVKQIFSPPVTMNLVAARAANMLAILPETSAATLSKEEKGASAAVPAVPSYQCGKEHAIPGAVALNVKRSPPRSLPPLTRPKPAPIKYDDWLDVKLRQKAARVRQLREEAEEVSRREQEEREAKAVRAAEAYSNWIRARSCQGSSHLKQDVMVQ